MAPTLVWPSATPRAPFVLAEGSSLLQTARPVRVDMYVRVCVIVFGVWTVSDSVLFVPSQHAGAAVSGLHHGRRGVAPAPRFQLYVCCAGPCCARGGYCVAASVAGASVAQGAV